MFHSKNYFRNVIFSIAAGSLISVASFAGTTTSHPVNINLNVSPPVVTGSFLSAKNSADNRQLIRIVDRGSNIRLVAIDSDNNRLICVTDNEEDIAALRNLNDSSFIRYAVDDGVCKNAIVRNGSQY